MGKRIFSGSKRAMASVEYVALAAVVLFVGFLAVYLLSNFSQGAQDVKISESRAYWKGAQPIRIDDWNAQSAAPDGTGNASAQFAMTITNPTKQVIVLKKILAAGMNFSVAYSQGSKDAGKPDNLTPIYMSPGEEMQIVLVQTSGPAILRNYEMNMVFVYEVQGQEMSQNGAVPVRGKLEYVLPSQFASIAATCPVGQAACNITGTRFCCGAGQSCSGTSCCALGQVACGGSCCAGSCSAGVCVPSGKFACGGGFCSIGTPCCNGVCGGCPNYAISSITSNATMLQNGQGAQVNFTTKNNGAYNASAATYTSVVRILGGTINAAANISVPGLDAGSNYTYGIVFICNSSNGAGNHTFAAYADNTSVLTETSKADNYNASSFGINCSIVSAKPDLVVSALFANSTLLLPSQAANITINTSNIGAAASAAGFTSVSTSGPDNPLSPSSVSIGAIASGSSYPGYVNFTCSLTALGTHTITATADATGTNDEENESNNANSSLQINCTAPDMVVANISSNATTLLLGQNASITAVTKNIGTGTAGASVTNLSSNSSANPLSIQSIGIVALAPGENATNSSIFACNASTLGRHAISAWADNASAVTESNETNNYNGTLEINCTGPDAVVSNLSANATQLYSGDIASITVITKNIGTGSLGLSTTNLSSSLAANPLNIRSIGIPVLAAGANATNYSNFTCNSTTAGLHTIFAWADNYSAVAETNETNNYNGTLQINCSMLPDYIPLNINSSAWVLLTGASTTVNVSVKNIGAASSVGNSVTKIGTLGPGSPFSTSTATIGGISVGANITSSFTFSCSAPAVGTHQIYAFADNNSQIQESNESNNYNTSALNITCISSSITSCMRITVPGAYSVANDLSGYDATTHVCIDIASGNVSVNCNGHTLTGDYNYDNTTGINSPELVNITLTNCNVNSYYYPAYLYKINRSVVSNFASNSEGYVYIYGRDMTNLSNLGVTRTAASGTVVNSALFLVLQSGSKADGVNAVYDNTDSWVYGSSCQALELQGQTARFLNLNGTSDYCNGVYAHNIDGSNITTIRGLSQYVNDYQTAKYGIDVSIMNNNARLDGAVGIETGPGAGVIIGNSANALAQYVQGTSYNDSANGQGGGNGISLAGGFGSSTLHDMAFTHMNGYSESKKGVAIVNVINSAFTDVNGTTMGGDPDPMYNAGIGLVLGAGNGDTFSSCHTSSPAGAYDACSTLSMPSGISYVTNYTAGFGTCNPSRKCSC